MNRKLERQKKFGVATTVDEILKEELRTYKVSPTTWNLNIVSRCDNSFVALVEADVSVLQYKQEGLCSHQVFPCFLYRLHQNSL